MQLLLFLWGKDFNDIVVDCLVSEHLHALHMILIFGDWTFLVLALLIVWLPKRDNILLLLTINWLIISFRSHVLGSHRRDNLLFFFNERLFLRTLALAVAIRLVFNWLVLFSTFLIVQIISVRWKLVSVSPVSFLTLFYELGLSHVVTTIFGRYDFLFFMPVLDFRRPLLRARLSLLPILSSLHRCWVCLFSSLSAFGLLLLY